MTSYIIITYIFYTYFEINYQYIISIPILNMFKNHHNPKIDRYTISFRSELTFNVLNKKHLTLTTILMELKINVLVWYRLYIKTYSYIVFFIILIMIIMITRVIVISILKLKIHYKTQPCNWVKVVIFTLRKSNLFKVVPSVLFARKP